MKFDESSLSHTTWECKYHIVFAPKFRRKIKRDIGVILRSLCERKGVIIRSGGMSRSYTHVNKYIAENECVKFHGIFNRKKYTNDI